MNEEIDIKKIIELYKKSKNKKMIELFFGRSIKEYLKKENDKK